MNDSNKKRNIHYGKKRRAKKNARVKSALNIIVITQVVILISVVSVLVVRAYLSTVTQAKGNPFTPLEMTYTDTETVEPGGSSYGIVIESGETTGTLSTKVLTSLHMSTIPKERIRSPCLFASQW